jgi:hypothetical protein
MRLLRTLALLVLVALAASGLVAPAAVAAETRLTIEGTPKRGIYHDEVGPQTTADLVRHRGTLKTTSGDPVPAAVVTLERKLAGETEWVELGEEQTNSEGVYTFVSDIAGNARYKVTHDEGTETVESGEVPLKAMRDFNALLADEKERVAILKGKINPGWDNKMVRWQKKACKSCAWRTVDKQRTGDNGAWRFAGGYPPSARETWRFRATIDGTPEFVRSFSAQLITTRER